MAQRFGGGATQRLGGGRVIAPLNVFRPKQSRSRGRSRSARRTKTLAHRNVVSVVRTEGVVSEWHGTWGWIAPSQQVFHHQISQNKGRIHVQRNDVMSSQPLKAGTKVSFFIYSEPKGLGAAEVELSTAPPAHGLAEAAAAGDDAPLPMHWEKHWSAENGEYYYWNRLTKESSWDRPDSAGAAEEPLPEGWERHYDADRNEFYYWHAETKTSSWERPSEPEEPAQGDERAQGAAPVEAARPVEAGPVLGMHRVAGKVIKWHGFFGWISPTEDLSSDLAPLLERQGGKIYVNWREVPAERALEVGKAVTFLINADDSGLTAMEVRGADEEPEAEQDAGAGAAEAEEAQEGGGELEQLEQQWAEEDAETADQPTLVGAAVVGLGDKMEVDEEAAPEGPLLPGWEEQWSEEHSCPYYWHRASKTAAWERPCVPGGGGGSGGGAAAAAAGSSKVWSGESSQQGAAKMATPMTPLLTQFKQVGREMTPITPADRAEAAKGKGKSSRSTPHLGSAHGVLTYQSAVATEKLFETAEAEAAAEAASGMIRPGTKGRSGPSAAGAGMPPMPPAPPKRTPTQPSQAPLGGHGASRAGGIIPAWQQMQWVRPRVA